MIIATISSVAEPTGHPSKVVSKGSAIPILRLANPHTEKNEVTRIKALLHMNRFAVRSAPLASGWLALLNRSQAERMGAQGLGGLYE